MMSLQEQVDNAKPGSVLTLPPAKEFQGPVVIRRAITIEGQGGTIWAPEGPVVCIEADGVQLQKLNVEVTGAESNLNGEAACALVVNPDVKITLNSVTVRGNVIGLDTEEGDWSYPRKLQLGSMKPGRPHEFKAKLVVPVACTLHSLADGVHVSPQQVSSGGSVEVTIKVDPLAPSTRLRGDIELRTHRLTRRIAVFGNVAKTDADASAAPDGQTIWEDAQAPRSAPRPPSKPVPAADSLHVPYELRDDPTTMPVNPQHAPAFDHRAGGAPMPPGLSSPSIPLTPTIVVSKGSDGQCATIEEAIRNARPGTRILVKPGLYREPLILDKNVDIIGEGSRSEIKIECTDGNCVRMQAAKALVRGVTIRAVGRGTKERFAVAIPGGELKLEDCDVSSDSLACIGIHGSTANPSFVGCRIHAGKSAGVLIYNNAKAQFDGCEIFDNAHACVEIRQFADPVFHKCKIHHGKQVGILVADKGKGAFEACDISHHAYAGVEISNLGAPLLRDCKIHDGDYPGVRIHNKGGGTFEDCTIFKNAGANVEVKQGSKPTFRQCSIYQSKQCGVLFSGKAAGQLDECQIYENAQVGVEIRESSAPSIRKCKIYGNKQLGVVVSSNSEGSLDDCEIYRNSRSGVEISKSNPTLRRCEVRENRQAGVIVQEHSEGTLEACLISENEWAGVAILTEASPTLKKCKIKDGKNAGVVVVDSGAGSIEDCEIADNATAGLAIARQGNPTVRQGKINRNKVVGVWAFQQASADLSGCEIKANKTAKLVSGDCQVRLKNVKT